MREKVTQLGMDVYRDLRDRRLLVIAVALLLAMLAVPLLVKGAQPVPATPPSSASIAELEKYDELDPAVLVEGAELRDFQDRLDGVSSNPFKQQLTEAPAGSAAEAGGAESGNLPTEDSLATAEGTEIAAPVTEGIPPEESFPAETVDPETPVEDPAATDPVEPVEVNNLVTFAIDVKVGPVGDAKVVEDVEEGEILPGENRPVLIYVGSDPDGSASSFVLSRDVIGATGEGNCAPSRSSCDFLRLGVGEEQELQLESTGATYRVKLLGITRLEEPISEEETESP